MDAALIFFALLWAIFGRDTPRQQQPGPAPSPLPLGMPVSTAPPWPQVVPPGLPTFPGSGWEHDEPPPAAVRARARELVDVLWRGGKGTFRVEQTAGRWIAYRAEVVASGKKGVVAYRVRKVAPQTRPAPSAQLPTASPRPVSTAPAIKHRPGRTAAETDAERAGRQAGERAAERAASIPAPPKLSTKDPLALLPTVRRGDGIKPQEPNANVRLMQRLLGIEDDGRFGPASESKLREFQQLELSSGRKGWTQDDVDGVCGPRTWTALLERGGRPYGPPPPSVRA